MNITKYWKATLQQDASLMRTYFDANASIRWHNTNEQFTVEEFIRANCEYPNRWDGEIEKMITVDDLIICVVHVFSTNQSLSFHVTSFIKHAHHKILEIDEYWGDDGTPPQWRIEKKLGRKFKNSECT